MYDIKVPYLKMVNCYTPLEVISLRLDNLAPNAIDTMPWPDYDYKPEVSFSIAYADDSIMIKYYVHEKSIRGQYSLANMPVHEDSCLEFFISFDDEPAYYNLELNCIGTCLFGYGESKSERHIIPEEVINKIRRHIVIEHSVNGSVNPVHWQLVVVIPMEAFIHHTITTFKGRQCKVNFYKCGDQLTEPHFLAWNNIVSTEPDFHLPEFFGIMHFE